MACVAAALLLSGCAPAQSTAPGSSSVEQPTSVQAFVDITSFGRQIDYEPLDSPEIAVAAASVMVAGRLADVLPGPRLDYGEGNEALTERSGPGIVLVVEVDEVLGGDERLIHDGRAYIYVDVAGVVDLEEAVAARPSGAHVVAVLTDMTAKADAGTHPAGIPAEAELLAFPADGLWLQGSSDPTMLTFWAAVEGLPDAWGTPATTEGYAEALRSASSS